MIRRIVSVMVLIGVIICFGLPGSAQAHVLKSDNGVTSVLHIAPYDAPVSAEKTRLEFQFGSGFSLSDYKTSVEIFDAGKQTSIMTIEPAYFGTSTLGIADITFPFASVYDVRVIGRPIASAPSFELDYMVRVTAGDAMSNAGQKTGQTVVISATIFLVFIMFVVKQLVNGKRYSKGKSK